MPTSRFLDMEPNNNSFEEQRALQLALELSMFGLNNESESYNATFDTEKRTKKSQNTTECVPVPSSEHVAEIVGRQGCKIKALRAKTNTYIKTPVRGEEPVFVVTGRKEDVSAAKKEILSAAEHFSQIRAQRKNNMSGSLIPGPNTNIPGQTTIEVRVPYRVVGLVVGPKGATIKRIQQQSNTYIVTPSREKEPIFEVTGLPENVEIARKEIEAHIATRTGGITDTPEDNDFHANGIDQVYTGSMNASNYINSLYKSDFNNFSCDSNNLLTSHSDDIFGTFHTPPTSGSPKLSVPDLYSSTQGITGSFSNGFGIYDDEGIGESPTFEQTVLSSSAVWSEFGNAQTSIASLLGTTSLSTSNTLSSLPQRSNSLGSADSGISDPLLIEHPPARRMCSDPLTTGLGDFSLTNSSSGLVGCFPTSSSCNSSSVSSSPTDSLCSVRKAKRDCIVCFESEIVAALVPCGHNMFCLECANRICEKHEPECPICRQPAHQAIRIYS